MIRLSVLYPSSEGCTFDHDYYREKHVPLVMRAWGLANADYGYQLAAGSSFFAQSGHHGPADFGYFSFITMATVGYGDLTPAVGLPRTFAVLEALTGQIFLVVLVARLVTLYTPRHGLRAELRERESGTSPAAPTD